MRRGRSPASCGGRFPAAPRPSAGRSWRRGLLLRASPRGHHLVIGASAARTCHFRCDWRQRYPHLPLSLAFVHSSAYDVVSYVRLCSSLSGGGVTPHQIEIIAESYELARGWYIQVVDAASTEVGFDEEEDLEPPLVFHVDSHGQEVEAEPGREIGDDGAPLLFPVERQPERRPGRRHVSMPPLRHPPEDSYSDGSHPAPPAPDPAHEDAHKTPMRHMKASMQRCVGRGAAGSRIFRRSSPRLPRFAGGEVGEGVRGTPNFIARG